eukprot:Seg10359.1 transcript_id=Seg10359.1/GoldUCD/mRNA.D3Y31 product="hypothetical protein" protein_id=Seg10359.1/GoldUCD/D3Y31
MEDWKDGTYKEVTIGTVSSPSGQDRADGSAKKATKEKGNKEGDRDDEFVEISVSIKDDNSDKHQIG